MRQSANLETSAGEEKRCCTSCLMNDVDRFDEYQATHRSSPAQFGGRRGDPSRSHRRSTTFQEDIAKPVRRCRRGNAIWTAPRRHAPETPASARHLPGVDPTLSSIFPPKATRTSCRRHLTRSKSEPNARITRWRSGSTTATTTTTTTATTISYDSYDWTTMGSTAGTTPGGGIRRR